MKILRHGAERRRKDEKMTKRSKIILWSAVGFVALVLVCCVVLFFVARSIYDGSFNYRCETDESKAYEVSDFEGLTRERHTFETYQGHTLVGYLYESERAAEKHAVVVFAHGMGGGGQTGYMDIFDMLTASGYYVFAYDATANDESEGEVMGGLPQGFIDLDYAIDYAEGLDEIKDLPFVLMGYSWGGLSVTNVLNYHPEVKAVVSLAGWNESMDLIDYVGCNMVGPIAKLLLPFASIHEYMMYGRYAFSTSMKGFKNTDAEIMIVHSDDDTTIPIEYGYEKYYEKYGEDERFTFKKYTGRDHSLLVDGEGKLDRALFGEIISFFDEATK